MHGTFLVGFLYIRLQEAYIGLGESKAYFKCNGGILKLRVSTMMLPFMTDVPKSLGAIIILGPTPNHLFFETNSELLKTNVLFRTGLDVPDGDGIIAKNVKDIALCKLKGWTTCRKLE